MRRLIALTGLSTLPLAMLTVGMQSGVMATADAAAVAPLPSNCQRDSGDFSVVRCTWTAGIGNRFTVPRGVTSIGVVAIGAPGGDDVAYAGTSAIPGGRGGVGRTTLDFGGNGPSGLGRTVLVDVGTPGGRGQDTDDVTGTVGAGGAPGGGDAGGRGLPTSYGAGGGGGYSAVRLIGTPTGVDARVVVGGGGGGAASGTGRATLGGDAGQGANRQQGGGGAGTTAAGGAGGVSPEPVYQGKAGRFRAGGAGNGESGIPGGGGGGGIYGGGGGRGGGASGAIWGGGGGGGSSTGGSREVSTTTAAVTLIFDLPLS